MIPEYDLNDYSTQLDAEKDAEIESLLDEEVDEQETQILSEYLDAWEHFYMFNGTITMPTFEEFRASRLETLK